MAFKTMDPALIRSLIEGEKDVLTPAAQEEDTLFKSIGCPVCYDSACVKKTPAPRLVPTEEGIEVMTLVNRHGPLPKSLAECQSCNTVFDPRSGVIHKSPPIMIHESGSDPPRS